MSPKQIQTEETVCTQTRSSVLMAKTQLRSIPAPPESLLMLGYYSLTDLLPSMQIDLWLPTSQCPHHSAPCHAQMLLELKAQTFLINELKDRKIK